MAQLRFRFKGFIDWIEIIWNDIRQFFPTMNQNKRYPLNCNEAKLHNYTEKDSSGKVLLGRKTAALDWDKKDMHLLLLYAHVQRNTRTICRQTTEYWSSVVHKNPSQRDTARGGGVGWGGGWSRVVILTAQKTACKVLGVVLTTCSLTSMRPQRSQVKVMAAHQGRAAKGEGHPWPLI